MCVAAGATSRCAESGETQAERLLRLYETEWGGSVDPYFSPEFSY